MEICESIMNELYKIKSAFWIFALLAVPLDGGRKTTQIQQKMCIIMLLYSMSLSFLAMFDYDPP